MRRFFKIVLITILALFMTSCGDSAGNGDLADNGETGRHSLPELPDCIAAISVADFGSGGYVVVDAQNRKCGGPVGTQAWHLYDDIQAGRLQVAEDGTIAIQREEYGEVYIYQNGVESIIPAPVEYFFLGESGNVIIYGKSDLDASRWDVSSGESRLISDKMRAVRIFDDGDIILLSEFVKRKEKVCEKQIYFLTKVTS